MDVVKLEAKARQELIARFHELKRELETVRRELREFGVRTIPKATPPVPRKKTKPVPPATSQVSSPQLRRLEKQIENARAKASASKSAEESKRLSDRVYELEDDLRLMKESRRA